MLPASMPAIPGRIDTMADMIAAREMFWNNVVREMLTSLSVMTLRRSDNSPAGPDNLFDGRIAVITVQGKRIPIAAVTPLLACGFPGSDAEKALSIALECTVFQIHTPTGEVFTLPLHEIRAVHSLSEELMRRMEEAASEASGENEEHEPFGFAAFTSLSRAQRHVPENPIAPSITGPGLPD